MVTTKEESVMKHKDIFIIAPIEEIFMHVTIADFLGLNVSLLSSRVLEHYRSSNSRSKKIILGDMKKPKRVSPEALK